MIVQSSTSQTEGLANVLFKLKASTEKRGEEKKNLYLLVNNRISIGYQSDEITKQGHTPRGVSWESFFSKRDLEYKLYCTDTGKTSPRILQLIAINCN